MNNRWLETQRELRRENYTKGLGFGYFKKCKLKVWYSCKKENVQVVTIRKPGRTGAAVVQPSVDVKVKKFYIRADNSAWTPMEGICFEENLNVLLRNPDQEYKFPVEAEKEYRDKYFGLCLGSLEEGQLAINENEICHNISTHIDEECEALRQSELNHYNRLIHYLKTNKLPHYLKDLVNSHIMCLEDSIFNLKSKEPGMDTKAIVAYIHEESEAKKVCKKFKDITDDYKKANIGIIYRLVSEGKHDELKKLMLQEQVCVFTEKQDTGDLIFYPEFQPEITKGDRVSDGISITR